ncbi:hypothetical protein [Streptomyces sp. NPDC002845]
MSHDRPLVREQCCKLLDTLLVADALDDLVAMLDDPDAGRGACGSAARRVTSCRCSPTGPWSAENRPRM